MANYMDEQDHNTVVLEGVYKGVAGKIDDMQESVRKELRFTSAQQASSYEALESGLKENIEAVLAEIRYLSQQNSAIYDIEQGDRAALRDGVIKAVYEKLNAMEQHLAERLSHVGEALNQRLAQTEEALLNRMSVVTETTDKPAAQINEALNARISQTEEIINVRHARTAEALNSELDARLNQLTETLLSQARETAEQMENRFRQMAETLEKRLADATEKFDSKVAEKTEGAKEEILRAVNEFTAPAEKSAESEEVLHEWKEPFVEEQTGVEPVAAPVREIDYDLLAEKIAAIVPAADGDAIAEKVAARMPEAERAAYADEALDYDVLAEKIATIVPEVDYDTIVERVTAAIPQTDENAVIDRIASIVPQTDENAIADRVAEAIPLVDYDYIAERVAQVLENEFDVTVDDKGIEKIADLVAERLDYEKIASSVARFLPAVQAEQEASVKEKAVEAPAKAEPVKEEPQEEPVKEEPAKAEPQVIEKEVVRTEKVYEEFDYEKLAACVAQLVRRNESEKPQQKPLPRRIVRVVSAPAVVEEEDEEDEENVLEEELSVAAPEPAVVQEAPRPQKKPAFPPKTVAPKKPAPQKPTIAAVAPAPVPAMKKPEDEEAELMTRYKRSFIAKIVQSEDEVKDFYGDVKNAFMSYAKVHSQVNWSNDRFSYGGETIAKIGISGKTLCLYVALDPEEFPDSVYHQKYEGDKKMYEKTPMMVKIKSKVACKRALKLVELLMERNGAVRGETVSFQYSELYPYKTDEELLEEGLIKTALVAKSDLDF